MDHHVDQPSFITVRNTNVPIHSDELQLAVLAQQNKRLICDILPFEVKHYQHQDELNILLTTAKQIKFLFCSRATASTLFTRESITCFTSYLSLIFN